MAEFKQLSKFTDKESKIKYNKPPFKLCFSKNAACLGQSYIHPCRPHNYVHYVTRKFYSKTERIILKENLQNTSSYVVKPKEKYKYPFTENERYGWYSDVSFQIPETIKDRRLTFRRVVNPLFAINEKKS